MSKTCLVLEGGSMRGLFSAAILDTFLDEGIEVDGIIGVSAGALFAPNYYSHQKGRALRYNKRFAKDYRFMSFPSFLLTGNLVNKQFAFYDVTSRHDVFDNYTYKKNNKGFLATVTNVETGNAEYLELNDVNTGLEVLRATSAIPLVSEIVEINGKKYLDGGVGDSIPVLKAKSMGYDKIIVVLTRDKTYRKEALDEKIAKLTKLRYHKYPKFVDKMLNRHNEYNETIDMINKMEDDGEIFVLRPSKPISLHTIERDVKHLDEVYNLGLEVAKESMPALKAYLNK